MSDKAESRPSPESSRTVPPDALPYPLSLRKRMFRIFWLAWRIASGYFLYAAVSPFLSRRAADRWKEALHKKNARRLQETTLALKGLLIKVGQFMSARVDILPDAYIQTLSLLQDQVPPSPYPAIRARLIEELHSPPEAVFKTFNPVPIASASLGQVHEATLRSDLGEDAPAGMRVAVKVQYPGIEAIVETDLKAIRSIVWVLQKLFTNIRFDILFQEFSRIVHQELNYVMEGRHAEQFRKNFEGDDRIVVPRVIWRLTTGRVLTLSYVEGIKINTLAKMEAAGIDKGKVATLLVESYMLQILKHRFFHGDPHPGNLFVQPGPRLVFVDFGLMQPIDPAMHRGMQRMIIAIIDRDIPAVAQGLLDLGFIARTERMDDIEKVVTFFMDRYRDLSPRAYRQITIAQIAEDLKTLFHVYPSLQVPNHFILVGRTAGMLNGLCCQLAPDLNIIELAKPYAKRYVAEEDWLKTVLEKGKEIASALVDLPVAIQDFLAYANSGRFRTHMVAEDLTGILTKIYKLAYRTVLAGVVAGASLAYSNLVRDVKSMEGILIGTAILVPSVALLYSFVRWR